MRCGGRGRSRWAPAACPGDRLPASVAEEVAILSHGLGLDAPQSWGELAAWRVAAESEAAGAIRDLAPAMRHLRGAQRRERRKLLADLAALREWVREPSR